MFKKPGDSLHSPALYTSGESHIDQLFQLVNFPSHAVKMLLTGGSILMYLDVCGGGETLWKSFLRYQWQRPSCGLLSEIKKTGPECKTEGIALLQPEESAHAELPAFWFVNHDCSLL